MAFPWMPPVYNVQGRTNQWISGIITHHDTFCGCNKPFFHLFYKLKESNGYPQCSLQEYKEIKKCLGISEKITETASTGTTTEEPKDTGEDAFDIGDLELLFEEDSTKDKEG